MKNAETKTRQFFDIPEIKINTTKYQFHSKICPHCNKKSTSKFLENVTHSVQYGVKIKRLILNLNVYHCFPYKRLIKLTFPTKVKNTLLSLKDMINTGQEADEKTKLNSYLEYICIVEKGFEEGQIHFSFDNTKSEKRKIKRSKTFNFLKRLSRYENVPIFSTEKNFFFLY